MVEAAFKYVFQSKLYVWKHPKGMMARIPAKVGAGKELGMEVGGANTAYYAVDSARLTGSKLRDLAWSLDVLDLRKEK